MGNRSSRILVALALIVSACLTGCREPQSEPQTPTLVAALPLTGDLSFLGTPGRQALEIAKIDAARLNTPFNFVLADTKADPAETATILRRRLDVNNNSFFLVTLSGPSLTARETIRSPDAMVMSVAIHPSIPAPDRPIVRFCLSAAQEGRMLIERLRATSEPLALVVSRDPATTFEVQNIILPALRAAGRDVSWVEWFDVGQRDFRNLAVRFRQRPVSQILLLGYGSDFNNVFAALASTRAQRNLRILGGIGFVELSQVPAGFTADQFSFIAPAFSLGLGGPAAANFRERYRAVAGAAAPYDAAYTYDAAMTFARLFRQGHTTPDAIIAALRGSSVQGVTGSITFDRNGEATTDVRWGGFDQAGRLVPRP